MKKLLKYAIVALGAFMAGMVTMQVICPSYDTLYEMSYQQLSLSRIEMIIAQDELLHQVFHDNEDYWYDVLMEGDAYQKLDSIRGGDWEDFYYYR